jgi:hypothetical protein
MRWILYNAAVVFLCGFVAASFSGCEDDGGSDSADPPLAEDSGAELEGTDTEESPAEFSVVEEADIEGTWTGRRWSPGGETSITLQINQSDAGHMWALAGSYEDTSGYSGVISGGLTKGTREFGFAVIFMDEGGEPTGNALTMRGEVSEDGQTISGTYHDEIGNSGHWQATR